MKTTNTARPIATLKTVSPAMLKKIRAHETALADFEKSRAALRAALMPSTARPYSKPAPDTTPAAVPIRKENKTARARFYKLCGTDFAPRIASYCPQQRDLYTPPAPLNYCAQQFVETVLAIAAQKAAETVERRSEEIDKEYSRFTKKAAARAQKQAERETAAAAQAEENRAAQNTPELKTARRAALEEKQPIFEALDFETVKAAFTNKGTEVLNVSLIAAASALKYALQKAPSDTFRAAYYSLVSYGISAKMPAPENSDSADILQAAALAIIESAAAASIEPEQYAKGLDQNGNPLELVIKVKQRGAEGKPAKDSNGKTLYEDRTITGAAVPRRIAIHAANKHIHKLKNRTSVQSFEHFSDGNSFDDPQKDKKLIDRQADFERDFADCITSMREVLKREELKICILVYRGYTQKEIAATMGVEQYKISRMLAKARKKLYEAGVFTAHRAAPVTKK